MSDQSTFEKPPMSQNTIAWSSSPAITSKRATIEYKKKLTAIPHSNNVVTGTLEPTLEML